MQIDVVLNESLADFLARVGCVEATLREDNQTLPPVVDNLTTTGFQDLEVRVKDVDLGVETLTQFLTRIPGCSRAQLLLLNPALSQALSAPVTNPLMSPVAAIERRPANKFAQLAVQHHIAVRRIVGPPPPAAQEPLLGQVNNPNYQWLTYECLFNQRPFRKTNQVCTMGLYRVHLGRLRVFLREDIDPALTKTLIDAFFPDVSVEAIEALSAGEWKWKTRSLTVGKLSPTSIVATRDSNVVYTKSHAVLPYNYIDNAGDSRAIGTQQTTSLEARLTKLSSTWQFWKTASRSCIVELTRVKAEKTLWQPITSKDYTWDYSIHGRARDADIGRFERGVDLTVEAAKATAFDLSTATSPFSVKTGVVWVGNVNQGGKLGHKDKLEENCIVACLRSDLIVARDQAAGRDPKRASDLIVQTELLSLTERNPKDKQAFGDGVQVRDLSVLDPTKIYIPPISIPFLDLQMNQICARFSCIDDPVWRDYWKVHYAEALGRAKAVFLLRYGLHMGSPNAQNWLLEFNPGAPPTPTGLVVARDVGDAYLHREIIWAQHGGPGLPPQAADAAKQLAKVKSKIIKFECEDLAKKWDYYPQETGSMYEQEYGPPGTRFLWHRFSTLARGRSVAVTSLLGPDPDAYTLGWQQVLATMSEWGIAHNMAYAGYLEDKLGAGFGIDWTTAPDPQRYLALDHDDRVGADTLFKEDMAWEDGKTDGASVAIHRFLASAEGQRAIKALEPNSV